MSRYLASVTLACGLLLAALAGPARADARKDLHDAFVRHQALKSYRAAMTDLRSGKAMSVFEYQAPDRFRITAPGRPASVIIGNTMTMNAGGRTMSMPLPKGMLDQYRNGQALADLEKGATVESLGPGTVGAQPARKYRFKTSVNKQQSSSDVWVGVASGVILQMETSGKHGGTPFAMRVAYSDLNSPAIRISAPK